MNAKSKIDNKRRVNKSTDQSEIYQAEYELQAMLNTETNIEMKNVKFLKKSRNQSRGQDRRYLKSQK